MYVQKPRKKSYGFIVKYISINFCKFLAKLKWIMNILGNPQLNCQVSNIIRTKSQHLKDSRTSLGLSLPNLLKPDVKSRMKT